MQLFKISSPNLFINNKLAFSLSHAESIINKALHTRAETITMAYRGMPRTLNSCLQETYTEFEQTQVIELTWQERERLKFQPSFTRDHCEIPPLYQRPFIYDHLESQIYQKGLVQDINLFQSLFLHISLDEPTLWAYTESPEKGTRDIQTRTKPGRFLQKFFPHLFDQNDIKNLVAMEERKGKIQQTDDFTLHITNDKKEIVKVYTSGPYSCMFHFTDYFSTYTGGHHPVEVYADSELSLAYLTNQDGEYVARALVSQSLKLFSRVYPTAGQEENEKLDCLQNEDYAEKCRDSLIEKLFSHGYSEDSGHLCGLSIPKIPLPHNQLNQLKFLMPYIDHYNLVDHPTNPALFTLSSKYTTQVQYSPSGTYGYMLIAKPIHCHRCQTRINNPYYAYTSTAERVAYCEIHARTETFYCPVDQNRYSLEAPHTLLPIAGPDNRTRRVFQPNIPSLHQSSISNLHILPDELHTFQIGETTYYYQQSESLSPLFPITWNEYTFDYVPSSRMIREPTFNVTHSSDICPFTTITITLRQTDLLERAIKAFFSDQLKNTLRRISCTSTTLSITTLTHDLSLPLTTPASEILTLLSNPTPEIFTRRDIGHYWEISTPGLPSFTVPVHFTRHHILQVIIEKHFAGTYPDSLGLFISANDFRVQFIRQRTFNIREMSPTLKVLWDGEQTWAEFHEIIINKASEQEPLTWATASQ